MARFLFWNVNRRELSTHVGILAREHDVDVVLLAELETAGNTLASALTSATDIHYRHVWTPDKSRVELFSRLPEDAIEFAYGEASGHLVVHRTLVEKLEILLASVHLPSKQHWPDGGQAAEAQRLAEVIRDLERQFGHDRTIVAGDFNMNPLRVWIGECARISWGHDQASCPRIAAND